MMGKFKIQNPNYKTKKSWSLGIWLLIIIWNLVFVILDLSYLSAKEKKIEEPIIVNGDTVEYSMDGKEVTASGNVMVIYKGAKLTCQKLTVKTQTKDAQAEGNVRLDDQRGVIEGKKLIYNFQTKSGMMMDSGFRANPYFGRAETVKKISDTEFVAQKGYATTCSYDIPHYRIRSSKIDIFPEDKIQTKNDTFYAGGVPVLYLPRYNHSLKDPLMHTQIMPGSRKDWGPYLLTATRYNLTDYATGRIYLDYRTDLGSAEGFGLNYTTNQYGKGDFKYYYTNEKDKNLPQSGPTEFQRYLVRWRHKWDIDNRSKATLEYYRIEDSKRQIGTDRNFLKDYFYREYEKDAQPKSYVLVSRALDYASLNFLMQKRTNRWYDHVSQVPDEKLPELSFVLPNYRIGESPFYFQDNTAFANLANKYPVPSDNDAHVVRFDTYNQFSLASKASIFWLMPYAGLRETYYSRDSEGNTLEPRAIFYSGVDLSTKLYRMFDFSSRFLGMDINGLRHIITPTIKYAYIHEPTILPAKLQTFDDIDIISSSNKVTLELVNKLQTKRTDMTKVDFATFRVNTDYIFKPKGGTGSSFSDFLFDLELLPYSWLRVYTNAIYDHVGDNFKEINIDMSANFGRDISLGIGNRYARKGGKELTSDFNWRLSPKWKFRMYERYQFASVRKKGLEEQEYSFTRDLHCWTVDFAYNINKDKGHAIWVIFRLKAFPEMEFGFDQSYHAPQPGSQSNP